MKERELVELVEKKTGAIFWAGYMMRPGDQFIAVLSPVDLMWVEFFCRLCAMENVGEISEAKMELIREYLHEISAQANALAMALTPVPNSIEIAISTEVDIMPSP